MYYFPISGTALCRSCRRPYKSPGSLVKSLSDSLCAGTPMSRETVPRLSPRISRWTAAEPPPHARSSVLVETWCFLSVAKASIPSQELESHYIRPIEDALRRFEALQASRRLRRGGLREPRCARSARAAGRRQRATHVPILTCAGERARLVLVAEGGHFCRKHVADVVQVTFGSWLRRSSSQCLVSRRCEHPLARRTSPRNRHRRGKWHRTKSP